MAAGLQVPLIPLEELAGRAGTAPPAQMVSEEPKAKEGGIFGATVTLKLVFTAHWPAAGVNV